MHSQEGTAIEFDEKVSIAKGLNQLANRYPNETIVWCHLDFKASLNTEVLPILFHHNKLLLSYRPSYSNFINEAIGYVDDSLFVNVNKKVSYPSWQMSSIVGMVHASVLIAIGDSIPFDTDFDYYLNSVAKQAMPLGLLCYSEPQLLKNTGINNILTSSHYTLFKFVKQHYRTRWVFLLFLNLLIYEKRLVLLPFLTSFCFRKRNSSFSLEGVKVVSSREVIDEPTIDVIIPTIGRKPYLYDVLKDLAKQILLPKKVVIVEQNPDVASSTELDYLESDFWPFQIKHIFTHQAGACNARNLALDAVESDWVFLADDDNRFESTLLEDVLYKMKQYGIFVATTSYIQNHETKVHLQIKQWPTFGAGNSFVKKNVLDNVRFNTSLEFGYGEDVDFGMQLRNLGLDVIYLPEPHILHLKAPIGGFRTKPVLKWQKDNIQPKPSPTVMLSCILHKTSKQQLGYKTTLFFKYFKHQKIKNPIRYLVNFRKQWNQSVFWANQLNQKQ
ncbi:glycosyltransferase family A protein [Flavobacterium sp. NG2]|uniref:glycosyltransferase family 2 protein n=1 Tax=Flavobacterium sp. NG2 TaxID=3097547 RepID=UPI002A82D03E|nr:glycosyltransferase family A protein [Flavobacterium sp. NG2]WPR71596.1 glycosyltransferase family A protein [Flavobacterium sp. NG2]